MKKDLQMFRKLLLDAPDFIEGCHWRRRSFEAGELILKEGEHSRKVFILLSGRVRVSGKLVLAGRIIQPGVWELEPGTILGELALVDEQPHGASVRAVTGGELAEIGVAVLEDYLSTHPHLGERFYRALAWVLAQRLRRANHKLLSLLGWGLKAHGYEGYLN